MYRILVAQVHIIIMWGIPSNEPLFVLSLGRDAYRKECHLCRGSEPQFWLANPIRAFKEQGQDRTTLAICPYAIIERGPER